jgi:fructose-1,6-bisphosphatase/inositol monophosphatase family enzyme
MRWAQRRPIAGVLYVPVKDQLYFAWGGGGAYRHRPGGNPRHLRV